MNSIVGSVRPPFLTVAFSADKNFLPHTAVALLSLIESNSSAVKQVFILSNGIPKRSVKRFLKWFSNLTVIPVSFLEVESSSIGNPYVSGHISVATYSRFLLADLLQDQKSVLYLDSDLLIVGSLEGLRPKVAEIENKNSKSFLFAVEELGHTNRLRDFGLRNNSYFNAGVLLCNLELWREMSLSKTLFSIEEQHRGRLECWDQDVLNLAADESWSSLDPRFNDMSRTSAPESVIVHFAGRNIKPWIFGSAHPMKALYFEMRKKTPYRLFFPQDVVRQTTVVLFGLTPRQLIKKIRKRVRRMARRLAIFLKNRTPQ